MASTTQETRAAGATLGMRCLTKIEYGNCLSGGNELSSWTTVEGMALKWGRGTQHPKTPRLGKKQDPIDCWQKVAISLIDRIVGVNACGVEKLFSGCFANWQPLSFHRSPHQVASQVLPKA